MDLSFSAFPLPTTAQPSYTRTQMSSSGLSRRRGAAAPANDDDNDTPRSPALTPTTPNTNTHTAAGSAFARGHTIAFDPRDLDGANEDEGKQGGKMPRLTIMEEVVLLGIKDRDVRLLSFP